MRQLSTRAVAQKRFGHATLNITPADDLPAEVTVKLREPKQARFFGPAGWQTQEVQITLAGQPGCYAMGPEIVDHVEAMSVIVEFEGRDYTVAWDRRIRPTPATDASRSSLGTAHAPPEVVPAAPAPKAPPPKVDAPMVAAPPPRPVPPRRSFLPWIAAGLVAVALIGAAIWWFQPWKLLAVSAPASAPALCSPEALGALGASAQDIATIMNCGATGDAEAKLRVIRNAAEAGSPEALVALGRWYDPAHQAGVGSSFAAVPSQAVDYYGQAAARNLADATPLLAEACKLLHPDSDPFDDEMSRQYCQGAQ